MSRSSGPSWRRRENSCGDHVGIERGAAVGDAPDRLQEVGDVHDAVLEQVADATAAVGQQLLGVGLLDVLGDDQHRGAGDPAAGLERRAQPLVAIAGRQADVDDGEVGLLRHHLADQRVAVRHRRHHRDPVVAQQTSEPVAQERQVLGDDYPQGSSA